MVTLPLQMVCSLIVLVRDGPWWHCYNNICDFVGNIAEYHSEVQTNLFIQNKDGQQMGATVFSSEGFFVVRERDTERNNFQCCCFLNLGLCPTVGIC